ncbi:MAG: transposase [Atopobiaceae bacterium]|nr:transposase [Atopobiaceae bacterium]
MQRTHRIRLYPNNKQASYLARSCGCARFAYNWALARWKELYELHLENPALHPQPNQYGLRRELNSIKRTEFPWMMEVSKYCPQQAIINLGRAFDNFFKHNGKYPQFKKKGQHDSFYIGQDQFKLDKSLSRAWIPNLYKFMGGRRELGWIRIAEPFRYDGAKIVCATVSRTADRWFIAITCELPDVEAQPKPHVANPKTVGIDVGVGKYVTSDKERASVPRAYRSRMRKLRREQQALSRKHRGSANYAKQKQKVARLHAKIADVRGDWLHKLTCSLTDSYDVLAIEDLNVEGMVKNHHLAISITDASFGEFRRQLEYKAREKQCELVVVDRFYPSSKTCSKCGHVKTKLALSERVFTCEECGYVIDRDLNAAINLKRHAVSSTVSACGEFFASACSPSKGSTQAASAKQEEIIKLLQ